MARFIPVNGRIFIIPDKKHMETTESGIILSAGSTEVKPETGRILSVDKEDEHPINQHLEVGVSILFNRFAASEVSLGPGKTCLIMNKDNVYAIFPDNVKNMEEKKEE